MTGLQEGAESPWLWPCAASLQQTQCTANAPRFNHFLQGRAPRPSLRNIAACLGATKGEMAGCIPGWDTGPLTGGRAACGAASRQAAPLLSAPSGPPACFNKAGHQNTKCGERMCVRLWHSCGFLLIMPHPPFRLLLGAPPKLLSVSVRDASAHQVSGDAVTRSGEIAKMHSTKGC